MAYVCVCTKFLVSIVFRLARMSATDIQTQRHYIPREKI